MLDTIHDQLPVSLTLNRASSKHREPDIRSTFLTAMSSNVAYILAALTAGGGITGYVR
jgi:hypothetical protein